MNDENSQTGKTVSDYAVVLFDGVCNFCNGSVRFIVRRDPGRRFRFAALQSEAGRELREGHGLGTSGIETMVFVENGRTYTRSTAALRIARGLGGLWPLAYYLLIWVPRG